MLDATEAQVVTLGEGWEEEGIRATGVPEDSVTCVRQYSPEVGCNPSPWPQLLITTLLVGWGMGGSPLNSLKTLLQTCHVSHGCLALRLLLRLPTPIHTGSHQLPLPLTMQSIPTPWKSCKDTPGGGGSFAKSVGAQLPCTTQAAALSSYRL